MSFDYKSIHMRKRKRSYLALVTMYWLDTPLRSTGNTNEITGVNTRNREKEYKELVRS